MKKAQNSESETQSISKEEINLPLQSKGNKDKSLIKILADKYEFTKEEVIMIKKRFDKLAENNLLNKHSFRRGLGLLGLENSAFLCDRIFQVIDQKNTGLVNFEEFLKYMHTLIDGNITQKAKQSFRMLDVGRQGRLIFNDIEKIVYEMSVLWNSLTGSQVKPTPNYLKKIFNTFDQDKDGIISFQDFNAVYPQGGDIFGWFEYLNQEDNPIEFWLSFEDQKPAKTKEKYLQNQVNLLQDELIDCLFMLQDIEECQKADINESIMEVSSSHFRDESFEHGGPSYSPEKAFAKEGDDDDGLFDEEFLDNRMAELQFSFNPKLTQATGISAGLKVDTRKLVVKSDKETQGELYNNIKLIQERLNHLLEVTQSLHHSQNPADDLNRINKEYQKVTYENYAFKSDSSLLATQNFEKIYTSPKSNRSSEFFGGEFLFSAKKQFQDSRKPSGQEVTGLNIIPVTKTNGIRSAYNDDSPALSSPKIQIKYPEEACKHTCLKQRFQKNVTVFFGHENWNLVLNMMIGMRMALKSVSKIAEHRTINENDYKLKVLFELIQQRLSSFDIKQACRFLEFAPLIFNDIRLIFGITSTELLRSVGPESIIGSLILGNMSSLLEQSSAGKSGSFFYYSEDGKFLLKTVSKKEFYFLKRILKPYHNYLKNNPNSLLIRIFGMYKMKFFETKKDYRNIYFIIMGNIFDANAEIDVKYDLKGSLHGRTSRKPGIHQDKTVVLKDMDFNEDGVKIQLNLSDQTLLLTQIESDSKFLADLNINDYSLLVGIHSIPKDKQISSVKSIRSAHHSKTNSMDSFLASHGLNILSINTVDKFKTSQNLLDKFRSGFLSRDGKKRYFMGVIDILTEYNTSKRFEYGLKRTFIGKDISCIPPQKYSERFLKFISSKFA